MEDSNNDDDGQSGALASKLNDLGKELLHEINSIAKQRKNAMDSLETSSATGEALQPRMQVRFGVLLDNIFPLTLSHPLLARMLLAQEGPTRCMGAAVELS